MSRQQTPTSTDPNESDPFVRWAALPPRDRTGTRSNTYDDRLGALVRQSLPPVGLDEAALQRVQRRLQARHTSMPFSWRNLHGLRAMQWVAVALSVLLVSSGVVAGTRLFKVFRTRLQADQVATRLPAAKIEHHRRVASPVALASPVELPVDPVHKAVIAPAIPKRSVRMNHHSPVRPVRSLLVATPSTEPLAAASEPAIVRGPSALAQESALLAQALSRLEQDPEAALSLLDDHAKRFARGALAPEALRMRVDALLKAQRPEGAEGLLRSMVLSNTGRDVELRLILAELTARHDCRQALAIFAQVINSQPPTSFIERALWGLAACRSQTNDAAGAEVGLREYLQRFPEGPHAAAARQRLAKH